MKNRISLTVKYVWNVAKLMPHIFLVYHQCNSLPLGPTLLSSSKKELQDLAMELLSRRR